MRYPGYPMAKNLQAKLPPTDTLVIYDKNTETTSQFVQEVGVAASTAAVEEKGVNVEIASSVRNVAEKSEVIITTLPEPTHVKNVFHSILHPPLPSMTFTDPNTTERLFIDCSTIDPTSSREVANAVHSTAQGRFVDAPMSGGVVGAQAGTLIFMLGAHTKHGGLIEYRVRPLLGMMGSKVLHLGGQGAGLSGKLANNYLLAISNIATAEAMNLGQRCGLDPETLSELINGSSGRCWSSEVNNPVSGISPGAPAEKDYRGGFGVELMKKDLRLAMKEAKRVGARVELGEKAGQVYDAVVAAEPGKDFSVVYKWLERSHVTS
ncbi:MAG: hypothetical protein Q9217_002674 [Psora testacea]